MQVAFLTLSDKGETDRFMAKAAEEFIAAGYRTIGVVQINVADPSSQRREMRLKVLPNGTARRISQDLGPGSSGCILDPAALEAAVGEVGATLDEGADLLIVNKFGKIEAEGRGFRALIGEALSRDIPVLIGLNPAQRQNFDLFAAEFAQEIAPDQDSLWSWLKSASAPSDASPSEA